MAADFFQQQDHARRSTIGLVVLFGLAVVAIMASIEVLLAAVTGYITSNPRTHEVDWTAVSDPHLIVVAVAGTLIIVGGGSLYKIAALRAGGRVVAEQLGGRLLSAGTSDLAEQRVLHVVEEMAIASGTPTPPVYVMDQEVGINAFAAGFAPADAVISVTRGAITRLTRDELQGVVAHEFSHILNGDMRIDIRLMGLLHGILLIGMLGYFILRVSLRTGGGRKKNGLAIVALGAGLAAIGFAGTFFGNLIKAAVSRQREFLADASAVQFTRHPDGLAGALKKIGGFISGSAIENPNAPEASHMFFSRATTQIGALFSTHPPLEARIRRLDPSWDGTFPTSVPQTDEEGAPPAASTKAVAGGGTPIGVMAAGLANAVASVGQPGPAHLEYAAQLIASLPRELADSARESYGARAVVCALLLDRQAETRQRQLRDLKADADQGLLAETLRLAPVVEHLPVKLRLPLVEIALPALRALTVSQREQFDAHVAALVEADNTVDLFEWCLRRILRRGLEADGTDDEHAGTRFRSPADIATQGELLLSVLAHAGQTDAGGASAAFEEGRRTLGLTGASLRAPADCGLADLDKALSDLDDATLPLKRQILKAAVACISADRQITAVEAELLRAVSASISCPMPPIVIDPRA